MNYAKAKPEPKPAWRDWLLFVVFAILLVVVWFFVFGCQFLSPVLIPAWVHLGFVLACSLLFLPFVLVGRLRAVKAALHGLFLLTIAGMWFFPISSRQPFLRDLASVKIGMTSTQVNAVMGKYAKGTGWPANPFAAKSPGTDTLTELRSGSTHPTQTNRQGQMELIGSTTYRHSDEGEYNSDWGVVSFKKGRVVKVEFMPD